ncbi:MAG: glycosyltransferase, partial [Planctomycetes bacterium]|nr:glycosyltransferase [Planctomycetota bacterium]
MRIALLSWESKHSIAVGGLGEHVTELGTALCQRGHEVHVFTRIGDGQTGYDCIDGVHYHRCPFEPHADFLINIERMCDSLVWHLAEAESYLNEPFDVVHGHDWLTVQALTQLKNRHDRPTVLTIHSTEFGRCGNQLQEGVSRRIREIEWEGTYIAEEVICVSGMLQNEVQRLYATPGDKMHVIYNGIDVKRFDARINTRSARRRHAIGADDPMVLFAGRMTRQKGPDLLVEAMPALLKEHAAAKFVFAGEGDMLAGLERRVASLGITAATRFVGHRVGPDLVGLFKSADVVCVPSRNEPFGIVILEAWGARKPVVATRNGGPAEFVTHETTGLTVSGDQDSIGWGLRTILSDKVKGRQMGRAGRKEAVSHFSWNTIAAATERVYHTALENRVYGRPNMPAEKERTPMAPRQSAKPAGSGGTARLSKPKAAKAAESAKTTEAAKSTKATKASTTARATPVAKTGGSAAQRPAPQTTPAPREARPASGITPSSGPNADQIRQRAFEIYLARDCAPGDPMADWLQAERDLRELYAVQS